ncbi:MAG: PAS domain-containing protein [Desulfobacteraceae bacterium]|jgi:nitrogen-specific signal transduction histidine kinase|nr:PAS domain-containing protein [Desulfobacteraceae bacterium]
MNIPPYLEKWMGKNLFSVVPMAIAVINPEYDLVYANKAFELLFGEWENRKCYKVYKHRDSVCRNCKGSETFKDGISRVNKEVGYNKNGRLTSYTNHTIPVVDDNGDIPFLIEMATDVTETEQIKKEHQLLFDQVPCSIFILDRNFRIVKTNKKIRNTFGDTIGMHCYKVLKGLEEKCVECTAMQTFTDGQMHTGHHLWQSGTGQPGTEEQINSHVTTVPIRMEDGDVDLVMEMAVDITQTIKLEDELKVAYTFMESMIEASLDGVIAMDANDSVMIFNHAAKKIFQVSDNKKITRKEIKSMLPEEFLAQISAGQGHVYFPETEVYSINSEKIPVRLIGLRISVEDKSMGTAITIQDLREIKQLENEKLEAERLAAVGQTVAGLAHGIKNLITGLEGGMYMLNTGMKKSRLDRIQEGMEMLDRNIVRVATFVKAFLSFSKGREIKVNLSDPVRIAKEVVMLYSQRARELGIKLINEESGSISPALMDSEGIHECLTNLVGNAIDACNMSEAGTGQHVVVRTIEKDNVIIYEVVDDGCGMDYELKQKVFTNFFTTKGLGGTGLGLLMTKKIIHEHGGKIDLESESGKGTTFRILLSRSRLPKKS